MNRAKVVLRDVSLEDKYRLDQTKAYLTGIEALVRLPILQHQRDQERGLNTAGFVSGYRGSPLGGVDQAMWRAEKYLQEHNIQFVPGVNEDLAATAVRGSQEVGLLPGSRYDGVFGMWYGKGPGLDRSVDAFRHANAAGTAKYGGVLAVVGDDHGCKSSTFPYQSEHIFASLSMPVLAPANVQEVLDLGIFGWELSRYCGCWVGLKAITENMDSAISAEIDPNRIQINIPEYFDLPGDGVNVRWPDNPMAQELRLNKFKIYAARAFARENKLNRVIIDSDRPRLGIITTGKSYLDVLQAFDDLGLDQKLAAEIGIRLYKVGMPWPLEPVTTHQFAKGLEEILVVEEKRSVIEDQLTGQLYNWPVAERPRVIGEYDEDGKDLLTNLGELTPAMIAEVVAERIERFYTSKVVQERLKFIRRKERSLAKPRLLSLREATYCSGCPHNTSTRLPEGSIAGGGIGCHYMSTWSVTRPAHNFTQMGGEGATWVGAAPFTDRSHMFQNLGDGTYFHSGILAIRQAVAAKVNITYKILYNDAVAMTGGQPLDGDLSIAQLIVQLKGEGIKRIELVSDKPEAHDHLTDSIVNLRHRDDLIVAQKELRETTGTTVLIYEQTCAAEKRRRRRRGLIEDPSKRVFINSEVCEGCGDCSIQSNCLSVVPKETELGRKRQIDQNSCNKDYSCLKGFCPSFVTVTGGELQSPNAKSLDHSSAPLPDPEYAEIVQPWNILVTGVGGTGVLTVAAVLSMAAHLENKGVATLNQTGLAQKFGPVVSHLRIANRQRDIHAVRIPAGDADLVIGCDLLVSASDDALAKLHKDRSHVVINETLSPTAEFIRNPDAVFHIDAMKKSIERELGEGRCAFLPAQQMATALLGDSIATNLFMVGYAFQKGLIPVSAEAIERALELNGVEIEFNKQAFVWGRRAYIDREEVEQVANLSTSFEPLSTLEEIVEHRYQRLSAYQNNSYADQYRQKVENIVEIESKQLGDNGAVSIAYARALYRTMAIKDEYEVARLYTDGRFLREIESKFSGNYRLQFHLAPPMISRKDADTGLPKKSAYPQLTMWLFRILSKLRFLRGTWFDVFSLSSERKLERRLVDELEATMQRVMPLLNTENSQQVIDIIELMNTVRGYGHIKEKNYRNYETSLQQSLQRLETKGEIQLPKAG